MEVFLWVKLLGYGGARQIASNPKTQLKFVVHVLKHSASPPAALAACLDVWTTREMCAAREYSSVARISERE